jgi:hypothetical protein
MKKLLVVLVILFCCSNISITEAAYHYVWNNDDYIAWINDRTIDTNPIKSAASIQVVLEDRHTGKQSIVEKCVFYRDSGRWYYHLGNNPDKPLEFYEHWWQPHGFHWLIDHGFLNN